MRESIYGPCGAGTMSNLDLFIWRIEDEARREHNLIYETSYNPETKTYTLKIKEKENGKNNNL